MHFMSFGTWISVLMALYYVAVTYATLGFSVLKGNHYAYETLSLGSGTKIYLLFLHICAKVHMGPNNG